MVLTSVHPSDLSDNRARFPSTHTRHFPPMNTLEGFTPNTAMFLRPLRVVPSGWLGHVPFGAWLVAAQEPSILVELGSHTGMSYAAFCQAIAAERLGTKCFAVDTWQGDEHAGFYGDDVFNELSGYNQTHYSGFSRLLRMTFDEAAGYFADGSVDLLHIDGLHTYDAVKHDFETWLPKLSDRAIVLFHDTNIRERGFGVWEYWSEISKSYPSFEFDHSAGLGVLGVGKNLPGHVAPLFAASEVPSHMRTIKQVFAALGDAVNCQWDLQHVRNGFGQKLVEADSLAQQKAALAQQNAGLQTELNTLQNRSQDLTIQLSNSSQALSACQLDRDTLQDRLSSIEAYASAIEQSLSYRITQPLRSARRLFK